MGPRIRECHSRMAPPAASKDLRGRVGRVQRRLHPAFNRRRLALLGDVGPGAESATGAAEHDGADCAIGDAGDDRVSYVRERVVHLCGEGVDGKVVKGHHGDAGRAIADGECRSVRPWFGHELVLPQGECTAR